MCRLFAVLLLSGCAVLPVPQDGGQDAAKCDVVQSPTQSCGCPRTVPTGGDCECEMDCVSLTARCALADGTHRQCLE